MNDTPRCPKCGSPMRPRLDYWWRPSGPPCCHVPECRGYDQPDQPFDESRLYDPALRQE